MTAGGRAWPIDGNLHFTKICWSTGLIVQITPTQDLRLQTKVKRKCVIKRRDGVRIVMCSSAWMSCAIWAYRMEV
eukprot:8510665-Heterocapsa_arctica.AAC.1